MTVAHEAAPDLDVLGLAVGLTHARPSAAFEIRARLRRHGPAAWPAVPSLLQSLAATDDLGGRVDVLRTLGSIPGVGSVVVPIVLRTFTADPPKEVVLAILHLLSMFPEQSPGYADTLALLATDEDSEIQEAAVRLIGMTGPTGLGFLPLLRSLVLAEKATARWSALGAIGTLLRDSPADFDEAETIDFLVAVAEGDDDVAALEALEAIRGVGSRAARAAEPLASLIPASSVLRAGRVLAAIRAIGPAAAPVAPMVAQSGMSLVLPIQVTETLVAIDPGSITALYGWLGPEMDAARHALLNALRAHGGGAPGVVPALELLLDEFASKGWAPEYQWGLEALAGAGVLGAFAKRVARAPAEVRLSSRLIDAIRGALDAADETIDADTLVELGTVFAGVRPIAARVLARREVCSDTAVPGVLAWLSEPAVAKDAATILVAGSAHRPWLRELLMMRLATYPIDGAAEVRDVIVHGLASLRTGSNGAGPAG